MGVCVLGSINLDNVCRVARLPTPGETLVADSFESAYLDNEAVDRRVAA